MVDRVTAEPAGDREPAAGRRTVREVLADRTGVPSMLRWALLPNLAALVLGGPVAFALAGAGAAASYATAITVVAAFFTLGILALKRLLAGPAELALAAALGVYIVQLSAVFALLMVVRQAPWLHLNAFAAGAIGAVILWQAGLVEGLRRARQPVYAPPASH